jgi:hypothetical protein
MSQAHKPYRLWALLISFAWLPIQCQDIQFLPELDFNLKVNSVIRLNFDPSRELGDPPQYSLSPSIQFHLKPLIRLEEVTAFDLDDAKKKVLVLQTGFQYLIPPDHAATTNRVLAMATSNFPLKGGFLVSDRNRVDWDWKIGTFDWRYRNKFTVQRTLPNPSIHLIPYVASEFYYESQYTKWSTTALYGGFLLPVGRHLQFDAFYENMNNTGKRPNKPDRGIGLGLHFYFSSEKGI